jgi:hypothetical protein
MWYCYIIFNVDKRRQNGDLFYAGKETLIKVIIFVLSQTKATCKREIPGTKRRFYQTLNDVSCGAPENNEQSTALHSFIESCNAPRLTAEL